MSNAVIDCLMNHRSVRRFKDQSVPEDVLQMILEAGTRAPSGGNLQNYSFIVIDDKETKMRLEAMDGFNKIGAVPIIIIVVVDYFRLQQWFNLYSSEGYSLNQTSNFFMSYWDALVALQNITVAAESLELGGYYIGNIHWYEGISELLNLPQLTFAAGMYCLGYPQDIPEKNKRLPLDTVVHRNRYKMYTDEDIYSTYSREDNIWKESTQARKDNLSKEKIFSAADFYARKKFSKEFVLKRSTNIYKNIRISGFKLMGNC